MLNIPWFIVVDNPAFLFQAFSKVVIIAFSRFLEASVLLAEDCKPPLNSAKSFTKAVFCEINASKIPKLKANLLSDIPIDESYFTPSNPKYLEPIVLKYSSARFLLLSIIVPVRLLSKVSTKV